MVKLRAGFGISLPAEHLRHILTFHEGIGYYAIVDISSMRDDAYGSAAKQLFQPQPGSLSTRLVQFRRVDTSESDALGPISKRVTINHLDLPAVDRALDATERCEGLPTEQRSEASATGSAHPFGLLVRMKSFLTVKSMRTKIAPRPCV